ncbi:MAG: hypothetical protein AB1831_07165 [Pseudomonadota bacterium]
MNMISMVEPDVARGDVAEMYGQIHEAMGRVPNGMRLFSSSPALLAQQWQQLGYYMQHPRLGFPLLAFVRLLVSQRHECEYCIGMNEALLIDRAGVSVDAVAAARRNPAHAPLEERDKAMLLAVLKAVEAPKSVTAEDLERLRALGWEDGDIVDAMFHGARNVAIDIMFNTFKIAADH